MIRAFGMFCGGGGSSFGAALVGATVVGGIDAWTFATEVFADNFPEASVITGRVEEIEPRDILDKAGSIDLLLTSPECTNHSCARGARPRSEASREIAFQIVRYARVMKPRWIIIENVIHMRRWSRYPDLVQTLRDEATELRSMCWMRPITECRRGARGCSFSAIVRTNLLAVSRRDGGPSRPLQAFWTSPRPGIGVVSQFEIWKAD